MLLLLMALSRSCCCSCCDASQHRLRWPSKVLEGEILLPQEAAAVICPSGQPTQEHGPGARSRVEVKNGGSVFTYVHGREAVEGGKADGWRDTMLS